MPRHQQSKDATPAGSYINCVIITSDEVRNFPYCLQDIQTMSWFSVFYLKGVLVNDLEKGVRFVIKRYRPVEKTAAAESNPSWFQLLVPAVDKPSVGKKGTQAGYLAGSETSQ